MDKDSEKSVISSPNTVTAVNRLVMVLDCFTNEKYAWSLSELRDHLGWPKATTHRYLTALENHGILHRRGDDKRFRMGYKLYLWGNIAAESMPLQEIARPIMKDLMDRTGETVLLVIYHNQEVVCLEKIDSDRPFRIVLEVGRLQAPHASSSCRVLMAYLPMEEIKAIIRDKGLPKLCKNTITDAEALLVELEKVRKAGYAHSVEEVDLDTRGVSAPIFDHKGQCIAGISIVGPIFHFTYELVDKYADLVKEAAKEISENLRNMK